MMSEFRGSSVKTEPAKKPTTPSGAGPSKSRQLVEKLLKGGQLQIASPVEQRRSFKKPAVLEKRLSEGPSLGLASPAMKRNRVEGPGAKKETSGGNVAPPGNLPGMVCSAVSSGAANVRATVAHPKSVMPAPTPTAAGMAWRKCIEGDRKERHKSAGGYRDYKRRVMKYSDDSDSSDD